MEKYKLKKDVFFYKAGASCVLTREGCMVLDDSGSILLYRRDIEEHPEVLDEWFEKIEEKKYGGRIPKGGNRYWYIFGDGSIGETVWAGTEWDIDRFESSSAFWTKEEAEKELKRRKAYVILKEDTKGFVPDWKDFIETKYFVTYNWLHDKFMIDYSLTIQHAEGPYFASREDASASLENHRQQWVDYLRIEKGER